MHFAPRTPRLFVALALFAALAVSAPAPAAPQRPPAQLDAAQLLHRIEKLGVTASVLYVGAHPDDENTRLISYLSNGRKVRTAYLSLTRGDGGQNLIGTELGDALGILRTQELLEARRIDGGEQFFTRAVDFGYSKSADETFETWGRQDVLADVVRVVRTFRPDVIVTRFSTDGSGGHGHHTASAILAGEAFELAADPAKFPEQIAEGLGPWQAKRLFFNASNWWNPKVADLAKEDPEHWVTVDVGGFDPLLGASFNEIAGKSRSQHKSQGFGAAETRGEQFEYLHLEKGAELATPDLLDGVELGWARVAGAERVQETARDLAAQFDPRAPERSVQGLSALLRALAPIAASAQPGRTPAQAGRTPTQDGRTPTQDGPARVGDGRALARHQSAAAAELVLQAAGVVVEASAKLPRVAAGDEIPVTLSVLQRRPGPTIEVLHFVAPGAQRIAVQETLAFNRPSKREVPYAPAAETPFDQPHWLAAHHDGLFLPGPSTAAGVDPLEPGAAKFRCVLRLQGGFELAVDRPLTQAWVDRVAGECLRTVVVTPPASIEVADPVAIVSGERTEIAIELLALRDGVRGTWSVSLPDGWSLEQTPPPIEEPLRRGERRAVQLALRRTPSAAAGLAKLAFSGPVGSTDRTMHAIDHPHVLPQIWYSAAEIKIVPIAVEVAAKTVGYVDGAGDEIPAALERLGIGVQRIDPASATAADLDRCDAVVTGIRAYNTVRSLARFQPELLAYVERGGTLVVQYNTSGGDLVLDATKIGPYPFVITRDRVTVEEAAPTFLAPSHPLMTTPNALDGSDFDGWVQERGLYFAGELDARYTALIAWSDPGEEPRKGALIACDHGKGRFVYTGISLFRQLPAGVPGAYRLLANLLARRASEK